MLWSLLPSRLKCQQKGRGSRGGRWLGRLPGSGQWSCCCLYAARGSGSAGGERATQMAESEKPERPEVEERPESNPTQEAGAKNTEDAGKSPAAAGAIARKNSDSKKLERAHVPEPGRSLQSNAVPAPFLGNAPTARAASPATAQPELVAGDLRQTDQAAIGGPRETSKDDLASLTLDQMKVAPVLHPLPSGLPVLSSATHGRQVVAIDVRNAVFASTDGGAHWTAVPTVWAGRAVKADLVSYGIAGRVGSRRRAHGRVCEHESRGATGASGASSRADWSGGSGLGFDGDGAVCEWRRGGRCDGDRDRRCGTHGGDRDRGQGRTVWSGTGWRRGRTT